MNTLFLPTPEPLTLRKPSAITPKIIAIGASTGGPQALFTVVGDLAQNTRLPMVIVQHMPVAFTTILAQHLSTIAGRKCVEGTDGETIESGGIYLAPGGFHMTVAGAPTGAKIIRLDEYPPVHFCRPAVDPLFRKVAAEYGGASLALILTGVGRDGLDGGRELVAAGGTLVAQDEATSVAWGMPGTVATDGICSAVLPVDQISLHVQLLVQGLAVRPEDCDSIS